MELLTNPFFTLGATMRDDKHRIMDLAEERSLASDEATVRDATAILTNPRRRLKAEFGWLPGLGPKRISEIISLLRREPTEVRHLETLPSLARANLLAEGLIRGIKQLPQHEVAPWIVELAHVHDEITVEQIVTVLNEERSVAGFPAILDMQILDTELRERRQYYRQAIKRALGELPVLSIVEVMTVAVDEATDYGNHQAPILIDDLVVSFEVEVQEFFQEETKNIGTLEQGIRDAVKRGENYEHIERLVSQLEKVVKNWDRIAQPIQVSSRSRGTNHDLSLKVARDIRNLAVELFNQHSLLEISRRLIALLQEVFAEDDRVVEILKKDASKLNEIARRPGPIPPPKSKPKPVPSGKPYSQKSSTSYSPRSDPSGAKWTLLLAVMVILVLTIYVVSLDDPPKSSASPPATQSTPPPNHPSSQIPEEQPNDLEFTKPPVGEGNTLSVAQIRWCLREDIRIEVLRPMLTTNSRIDQFNTVVDDYNRRCGNFRYRRGSLVQARREVELMRLQITANVIPPWQLQLIRNAQNALKALGYTLGTVDGFYDASTKLAVESFQRDIGVVADGKVTQALLERIRQEATYRRSRGTTITPSSTKPSSTTATRLADRKNNYFTRGSHEDDVLRVQGTPSRILELDVLEYDTWYFNTSTVEIDSRTRRVRGWSNKGNLKVRLVPGSRVTTSLTYTRGSHEDDLIRLQGTPSSILELDVLGYETWYFDMSTVQIDSRTRQVLGWNNKGNLKVRLVPGRRIVSADTAEVADANSGDVNHAMSTIKNPVVRIQTTLGSMKVKLYPKHAPETVANFLYLVGSEFYDGLIFHRVIAGSIIQVGGYDANMTHRETPRTVVNESIGGLLNKKWTLSMARTSDPNSASSQFHINMRDNPHLDAVEGRPGYTVFGSVTNGRRVARAIAAAQTHSLNGMAAVPVEPIIVINVEVTSPRKWSYPPR